MTTNVKMNLEKRTPNSMLSRLVGTSLAAMLAATAANFGLYYAAGILFPEVTAWPGAGPGQIAGASVVYLLIGAIAFAIVNRISSTPRRHYLIVATVGLLFSLVMPVSAGFGFGSPGTPSAGAAAVITLSLMHLVSFAISVPLFTNLASDKRG